MSTRIKSILSSKKKIAGSWTPPPDKSITHRSIFFASLTTKKSHIKNPLLSGDCLSTLNAFKNLGVSIKIRAGELIFSPGIKSDSSPLRQLKAPKKPIDCGNSGTTMRLLSGVLAAQKFKSTLVGDKSLTQRPMKRVMEPLKKMGAAISARDKNFPPLKIDGNSNLKPIFWKSSVSSAQVKSSIFLAGLFANGKTVVEEPEKSRDHSERILKSLGVKIQFNPKVSSNKKNRVSLWGPANLKGLKVTIPGDFSSAAFFLVAAAMVPNSHLVVRNVNLNPTRTGFLSVMKRMGSKFSILNLRESAREPLGDIKISYFPLKGTRVLPKEIPTLIDEIPILAVLATQATGKTMISGAEELRVKESDRIHAIVTELKKMGADIEERKDGMVIQGPTQLKGTKVQSYGDHRMAMSLAIAGLVAEGETFIEDFDCVKISFPGFLDALKGLVK